MENKFPLRKPDTSMCCRRFYLPYPMDMLKEDYEKFTRGEQARWLEIDKIYPMLIYLGEFKYTTTGVLIDWPQHHYSCKNLDVETGKCLIYDQYRPALCTGFPDNVKEEYKRCRAMKCKTFHKCNGIKQYKKWARQQRIEKTISWLKNLFDLKRYFIKNKIPQLAREIDQYDQKCQCDKNISDKAKVLADSADKDNK